MYLSYALIRSSSLIQFHTLILFGLRGTLPRPRGHTGGRRTQKLSHTRGGHERWRRGARPRAVPARARAKAGGGCEGDAEGGGGKGEGGDWLEDESRAYLLRGHLPHLRRKASHEPERHLWRPVCCAVCSSSANGSCEQHRRTKNFSSVAIRGHQRSSAYLGSV